MIGHDEYQRRIVELQAERDALLAELATLRKAITDSGYGVLRESNGHVTIHDVSEKAKREADREAQYIADSEAERAALRQEVAGLRAGLEEAPAAAVPAVQPTCSHEGCGKPAMSSWLVGGGNWNSPGRYAWYCSEHHPMRGTTFTWKG